MSPSLLPERLSLPPDLDKDPTAFPSYDCPTATLPYYPPREDSSDLLPLRPGPVPRPETPLFPTSLQPSTSPTRSSTPEGYNSSSDSLTRLYSNSSLLFHVIPVSPLTPSLSRFFPVTLQGPRVAYTSGTSTVPRSTVSVSKEVVGPPPAPLPSNSVPRSRPPPLAPRPCGPGRWRRHQGSLRPRFTLTSTISLPHPSPPCTPRPSPPPTLLFPLLFLFALTDRRLVNGTRFVPRLPKFREDRPPGVHSGPPPHITYNKRSPISSQSLHFSVRAPVCRPVTGVG